MYRMQNGDSLIAQTKHKTSRKTGFLTDPFDNINVLSVL